MVPNTTKRGKTDLPTGFNFMCGHVDCLTGDRMSRPYYSRKVVRFH